MLLMLLYGGLMVKEWLNLHHVVILPLPNHQQNTTVLLTNHPYISMRYLCVILLPTYIDIVVLFDFSKVLTGE
jgi:hypothetical protein